MKRDLVGKGKQEYVVERLIEREVYLIREMNATRPVVRRKRYELAKKIRYINDERDICYRKLNPHIKESQRINYINNNKNLSEEIIELN
jgi:hypothetical protein